MVQHVWMCALGEAVWGDCKRLPSPLCCPGSPANPRVAHQAFHITPLPLCMFGTLPALLCSALLCLPAASPAHTATRHPQHMHPHPHNTRSGVSLRGLFIINPEGIVEQITINNLPIGRSVDETLRLLQ